MSDQTGQSNGQGGNGDGNNDPGDGGTTPPANQFTPITSQADLDRIIGERVSRERAKYSDYKDLKAKANKFDEMEAANQTELEKATKRVTDTEGERDQAKAEALRLRIANKHGITEEDADLFLTGTDEERLTAQAKRLSERASDRKKQGNHVPREGTSTTPSADEERAAVRSLFGSGG